MSSPRHTVAVSDPIFRAVYDSPKSLPGKERWLTPEADVRRLERLLGLEQGTIGAPLWLSGSQKECPQCGRLISWLDIVSSALERVHDKAMIARVILGDQKFVNTEAPRAIAGLRCSRCKTAIQSVRSFKCHNWAYARPALLEQIERIEAQTARA